MCPFCKANVCDADLHWRMYVLWWMASSGRVSPPTQAIHTQWFQKRDENPWTTTLIPRKEQ